MEKQEQRKRGEEIKYFTDEDKKKNAITKSKSKYMLNKEWFCDICKNYKNYSLAGKHSHIKTKTIKIADEIIFFNTAQNIFNIVLFKRNIFI